jgi:glycosyltransferase
MKISIITATYNSKNTIIPMIESLNKQTYAYIEHIIIDGGSADGTLQILRPYLSQSTIVLSERDSGVYDALNKGLALATGDVIGFLHADDMLASSDVLSEVAKAFSNPKVDAVYGNLTYIDNLSGKKDIRIWQSSSYISGDLASGWMPPHPTLYVRKKWYTKIGNFNTALSISADYFSILQFFSMDQFESIYIDKIFVRMRLGGISNRSIGNKLKKSSEDWRALRLSGFSVLQAMKALIMKNTSKVKQYYHLISLTSKNP